MGQTFSDPIRVRPMKGHTPFPPSALEKSVAECFESTARKFAKRVAVIDQDQKITFLSLNQKANRLAHAIRAKGCPREVPVAFLLGRDADAIITVLGILKASCIYAALNPADPVDRLQSILDDLQPGLIISNNAYLSLAQKLATPSIPILNLDDPGMNLSDENPGEYASPTSLAAIFYTSGSTGKPKGVVLDHRALLHRSMIHINLHGISPEDKNILPFLLGFAWSIAPLFCPLLTGSILYPCNFAEMKIDEIVEWLNRTKITILHLPPQLFRQILAHSSQERFKFPYIRLTNVGSDKIYPQDFENWRRIFPKDSILAYGLASSETGTITRKFFNSKYRTDSTNLPVGYPVPDVRIRLVDDDGSDIENNQIGEIAVQSWSLTRGYWDEGKIHQNLEASGPDDSGQSTLRTGDFGRIRADGALEFVGRQDNLVKIRGFRVVISEIEAVLAAHPAVKQLVVAVRPVPSADQGKRLIAYIVTGPVEQLSEKDLRNYLAQKLPAYMIPARFVFLESIPLNPNGKTDLAALPEPKELREESVAMPRNETEAKLAKLWSQVLQTERIGVNENFFDLGGDSLSALELAMQIKRDLGYDAPLYLLFKEPTIAYQARLILQ